MIKIGRKTVLLAAVLLSICLVMGCQGNFTATEAPSPRIISLAPSITEILFALDLEEHIVGITTCCDYPAGTGKIEKVATFSGQANMERILVLEPDIVFSTGLEQAPLAEKLRRLGLEVVVIYPQSLDELFAGIIEIGRVTRRQTQAQTLVKRMKQRIERISRKVKTIPIEHRPKVFVEIAPDPLMTAGAGSFVDELIEIAGGKNIARDTTRAYSQFSPEIVLQRNPDYIILGYMQAQFSESIFKRLGWQDISAVKKEQIIADIDPDLFLRPGPRIVEGLEKIHLRLFR